MDQRLSVITLGVGDLERARTFYERLGWHTRAESGDDVVFFQGPGYVIALWDREKLARDKAVVDGGGWRGVTLAHNVGSRREVEPVLSEASAGPATITREGAETF